MTGTVHATAPVNAPVTDAYHWTQLAVGVGAMVMIANYQYGWTFFVPDIQKKFGWIAHRSSWLSHFSCCSKPGSCQLKAGLSINTARALLCWLVRRAVRIDVLRLGRVLFSLPIHLHRYLRREIRDHQCRFALYGQGHRSSAGASRQLHAAIVRLMGSRVPDRSGRECSGVAACAHCSQAVAEDGGRQICGVLIRTARSTESARPSLRGWARRSAMARSVQSYASSFL